MAGTLPMHTGTLPPIPMPRHHGYGYLIFKFVLPNLLIRFCLNTFSMGMQHSRSNGMRTLENSSSSEEEDRTDLLGRHFQVPRPKSRSNGSIAVSNDFVYYRSK